MSTNIETAGAYRGKVLESAVGQTKKGYPQLVLRVSADEKWMETAEEMEANGLTEPGWVDVTGWNEQTLAYLVLHNGEKPLFHYEQVMIALGWDGTSYSGLAALDTTDKQVLFRMEDDEYDGNIRVRLNWLDAPDAPIRRELNTLDADKLKDLDAKFANPDIAASKGKSKPTAAKASTAKAAKGGAKKGAKSAVKTETAAAPKAEAKKAGPPAAKATPPGHVPDDSIPFEPTSNDGPFASVGESAEGAKMDVWEIVAGAKGVDENALGASWVDNTRTVGGDRDEDKFTRADWIKVGQSIVEDLKLTLT